MSVYLYIHELDKENKNLEEAKKSENINPYRDIPKQLLVRSRFWANNQTEKSFGIKDINSLKRH